MNLDSTLSKSENELLSGLGYLVVRWNYLEYWGRQILRQYVEADSIDAPGHLRISAHGAMEIEKALKKVVSEHWAGEGRPYLDRLILVYEIAREHRNHLVHGIYLTADTNGPCGATAILFPAKPIKRSTQLPSFVQVGELRSTAQHIHDLAMYARTVMLAFDGKGQRKLNSDGKPEVAELPELISPLPVLEHITLANHLDES